MPSKLMFLMQTMMHEEHWEDKVQIAFGLASSKTSHIGPQTQGYEQGVLVSILAQKHTEVRVCTFSLQTRFLSVNIQALNSRRSEGTNTEPGPLVVHGMKHPQVGLVGRPKHNASVI